MYLWLVRLREPYFLHCFCLVFFHNSFVLLLYIKKEEDNEEAWIRVSKTMPRASEQCLGQGAASATGHPLARLDSSHGDHPLAPQGKGELILTAEYHCSPINDLSVQAATLLLQGDLGSEKWSGESSEEPEKQRPRGKAGPRVDSRLHTSGPQCCRPLGTHPNSGSFAL